MTFAEFVALITDVLAIEFPFSTTVSLTLGQLIIWTIVLSIGLSVAGRLMRG